MPAPLEQPDRLTRWFFETSPALTIWLSAGFCRF